MPGHFEPLPALLSSAGCAGFWEKNFDMHTVTGRSLTSLSAPLTTAVSSNNCPRWSVTLLSAEIHKHTEL